jgi:hypothetical protein
MELEMPEGTLLPNLGSDLRGKKPVFRRYGFGAGT